MLDYQDELGIITHLIAERPYGMTITSIASASGIGRNRVAKYLDVLTLSGRVRMKPVGNAKVFFLTDRIPVASMLNLSSDYVIVINNGNEIVYVSDNLLRDEDLRRDEVVGTNISKLHLSVFPFHELSDSIQQAIAGGEIMTEYSVPNGRMLRWFKAKIISTILEGGTGGAGIVLEEITDLKAYEIQLKEKIQGDEIRLAATSNDLKHEIESHGETETARKKSEQRYRTLVEHAREGILLLSRDGGIIMFVNPAMAAMLGYATREMHGRSAFTLTNDIGVQILHRLQARLTEDIAEEGEIQLFRRNGVIVHAEFISTPLYAPGNEDHEWLLLINDVSDQKEKEAAIRFTNNLLTGIIEGSNQMVATIDTNYTFVSANTAYQDEFERVWGQKPEAGRKVVDLLSHMPDELIKSLALWKRVLEGEEYRTVQTFEGGSEYEIWFFPLRDENGKIYGAANILTDISNLEKTVILFQEQDIQLRELMQQLSTQHKQSRLVKTDRS